jgi:hypothetical protein
LTALKWNHLKPSIKLKLSQTLKIFLKNSLLKIYPFYLNKKNPSQSTIILKMKPLLNKMTPPLIKIKLIFSIYSKNKLKITLKLKSNSIHFKIKDFILNSISDKYSPKIFSNSNLNLHSIPLSPKIKKSSFLSKIEWTLSLSLSFNLYYKFSPKKKKNF